ncbi:WXG100 family type VII secretion target [Ectobacillus sp. JY-23]
MGTTQQAFFSDFFQAKRIMHDCVKNLNEVEWELRQIAKKFREADGKSIW